MMQGIDESITKERGDTIYFALDDTQDLLVVWR